MREAGPTARRKRYLIIAVAVAVAVAALALVLIILTRQHLAADASRHRGPPPIAVRTAAVISGNADITVTAPGTVVALEARAPTRPLYVAFAVPAEHLARIYPRWRRGEALGVEALDGSGKAVARGTLAAIDDRIDTNTGTVQLKGLFANEDDALAPDQLVNARLTVESESDAALAPAAAVQRGASGTYVYVVKGDNTVSLRPVSVGAPNGDLIAIESGLQPGERVVIDGLDKVREGAPVEVIEPGPPTQAPTPDSPG